MVYLQEIQEELGNGTLQLFHPSGDTVPLKE